VGRGIYQGFQTSSSCAFFAAGRPGLGVGRLGANRSAKV
jgi:hypothetical protein